MKKLSAVVIFIGVLLLFFSQSPYLNPEIKKAANFNLRDPWDYKFSLEEFQGKPVILHFFRIYCGGRITKESLRQIEELNKVCTKLCKGEKCTEGDLQIISITLATCPTTDLKEWAKYFNINWLLGNDYDDYKLDIFSSYTEYLKKLKDPALIFLNQNQEIVFSSNFLESSQILEKVKELISVKKPEKSRDLRERIPKVK